MAHRQKYLAGADPILTLEEAYWQVMSTLTKVDDLTYTCTVAGIITSNQRLEADNLYCTLMNQDRHQDLIWHSEADADKFYNTREWIQIIADETSMKLADIKSVMSLPGTPRPRQADSHGQQTLPPPGSFPRQHQTETLGAGSKWHPTTNTVKRKLIYSDDQRHSHLAEMGPARPTNDPKDRPLSAD